MQARFGEGRSETYCPMKRPERIFGMSKEYKQQRAGRLLYCMYAGEASADMSGWEAVAQVRQMDEFTDTPIMAVTAHVSSEEIERAKGVGCTVHLAKPSVLHRGAQCFASDTIAICPLPLVDL